MTWRVRSGGFDVADFRNCAFFRDAQAAIAAHLSDAVNLVHDAALGAARSRDQLIELEQHSESATAHGETHVYKGADLRDVLHAARIDETESLHGPPLRRTVTIEGTDGYRAVFALAELDSTLGDKRVFLVNEEDGAPLPASDGPWRIVVPTDKRPARWVRQVVRVAEIESRFTG